MPDSMKDERSSLESRWNAIRSAIRVRWPEISADDLRNMDGDSRKLVALVNQKTRMPLHEIEEAIDELAESSGGLLTRLANHATVFANDAKRQITEPMEATGRSVRKAVAECPATSMATFFGAGLAIGVGLVLFLTPTPSKSSSWPWER